MSSPKIEPTRAFSLAGVPDASIPKSATTRTIPAGGNIQDAVISHEQSGVVDNPANPAANANTPPLSTKPIPTSSVAERLRERLKKGG